MILLLACCQCVSVLCSDRYTPNYKESALTLSLFIPQPLVYFGPLCSHLGKLLRIPWRGPVRSTLLCPHNLWSPLLLLGSIPVTCVLLYSTLLPPGPAVSNPLGVSSQIQCFHSFIMIRGDRIRAQLHGLSAADIYSYTNTASYCLLVCRKQ